ncbi:MAG: hypothetical protein ACOYL8_01855 [Patescibacteria group bacterium]
MKTRKNLAPVEHIIDCNLEPNSTLSWKIVRHIKGGIINFDVNKVTLYLSEKQQKGEIQGEALMRELNGLPVMNSNVLTYLIHHPEIIPKKWKNKKIYFWGTISSGEVYTFVHCLCWFDGKWVVRASSPDRYFGRNCPAILYDYKNP